MAMHGVAHSLQVGLAVQYGPSARPQTWLKSGATLAAALLESLPKIFYGLPVTSKDSLMVGV